MKTKLLRAGLLVFCMTALSATKLMAFTAVTDGNWSDPLTWGGTAPTSNVNNQDIIIPSGIDVVLDMDVTFTGLLNNFTVDGTLTSTDESWLEITSGSFDGNGDIDIQRIIFSGVLITYSHDGDLMVGTFRNDGPALAVTSQVTVSDTLELEAGSVTLNTGANLMLNADGMIIRNDGTLLTSGGIFNSAGSYGVLYIGGSKTTGIEINSMNVEDAEIDLDNNTDEITLGSDLTVNGNLELSSGRLNVAANDLEIMGNLSIETGSAFTTAATSVIRVETDETLNSGLIFTTGSSIDELTIDNSGTGSVELQSDLSVAGELQLHDGMFTIQTGSTLTMNVGSLIQIMEGELENTGGNFVGTASYDVEYIGDSTNTTGPELSGTGLNDVMIDISEGDIMLDNDVTVNGELEMNNGRFNLNGNNLILEGTLSQDMGAMFVGNTASDLHLNITVTGNDTIYFDGEDQNLDQFIVNVTGGDIVLGSGLIINDELTMTSGNIMLTEQNLVIVEDADITGYNENRYIMTPWAGGLEMFIDQAAAYEVYPVGTEDDYSPAMIQQTAASANFKVKAFEGVFVGGTENSGFNSSLTASLVDRTWLITSDAANVDMNLKLGWTTAAEINGFDRTNAFISHYTSGNWDTETSANASAGANNTYEIERTGITSLSPFTVADEDAELSIDEMAASEVNLYPNPCTEFVNIDYASANTDLYTYAITDASGRNYEVVKTASNQVDVTGLSTGTYMLKMTNVKTNKATVKQFVKK